MFYGVFYVVKYNTILTSYAIIYKSILNADVNAFVMIPGLYLRLIHRLILNSMIIYIIIFVFCLTITKK